MNTYRMFLLPLPDGGVTEAWIMEFDQAVSQSMETLEQKTGIQASKLFLPLNAPAVVHDLFPDSWVPGVTLPPNHYGVGT